jgi:hypothetical protein
MNGDLVPAVVAAGGGSAMLAGVYLHEHREVEAMRRSRVRLALVYPLVDPVQGKAILHALSGLADVELIFEVVADSDGVRHAIWVPAASRASVTATLTGLLPGLRVSEALSPQGRATLALKAFVPTPTALVTENPEAAVRTLLSGLAALNQGEEVVIRWSLRPATAPSLRSPDSMDRAAKERERIWRQKTAMTGGFQVSGLVLVRADSVARARGLSEHIASSLRSRRGSVGALRLTSERGDRRLASLPKITRSSGWLNAAELLALALPVSEEVIPGMEVSLTRQIAPRKELARTGRPLFVAEYQGQPRPVAVNIDGCLRHVAILGASGGGKSTILAAGILSHIAAGDGGILIDPRGDLTRTVIDHAGKGAERITLLDPSADIVPGVDLFSGGDPDLRSEVLVQIFRGLFKDAWGPRTDAYIRLGVRTLAEVPGATLLDLPQLFLDPHARRRAVGFLRDPLLIGQWQVFEGLSEVERMQHLQAPLSRVLSLITRPPVQAVFGPDPRLDIGRLLRERGWLLVPLSSGTIGSASARIIGSALTFIVWSHISARAAIAPERRHPLFLFFDELQALTDQGIGLEDLLEQARGYGASVTVATQAIGRTPDQLRHSLLSNVSTLVSLRAGATEAALIARELPGLLPRDIQSLPPYHVAARVATGKGSGSVVVTGRTEPLGEPIGGGQRIRERSAQAFGRSRAEIQAAIRERYGMAPDATDTGIELGRTRRQA